MDLPPGVEERGGKLVRIIPRTSHDGRTWDQVRPVSLDFREAKEKRMDFYHPELGWIREGYKREREHTVGSVMLDDSQAVAVPESLRDKEETASG